MGIGEVCNFGAYAFQPAIVIAPLGALSVAVRYVIEAHQYSAILSAVMLKERLSFSGSVGVSQCIFGSIIIVMNAPETNSTQTVRDFFAYAVQPGFLVYTGFCVIAVIYIVFFLAPKYGSKNPAVYISVVAIVGSYLVLSAQGFGAAMVYSFSHWETDNQFKEWSFYLLLVFVVLTAVNQINFLNKALNCFSPSVVAPINYVFFTTMTLISSAVLFQGFNVASVANGISMVVGFLVIVGGVALLFQYSLKLNKIRLLSTQIEDINDAEEDEETTDENPIKIMTEGLKSDAASRTPMSQVSDAGPSGKGKVVPESFNSPTSSTTTTDNTSLTRRIPLEPVARGDVVSKMEMGALEPVAEADTPNPQGSAILHTVATPLPAIRSGGPALPDIRKSTNKISSHNDLVQGTVSPLPPRHDARSQIITSLPSVQPDQRLPSTARRPSYEFQKMASQSIDKLDRRESDASDSVKDDILRSLVRFGDIESESMIHQERSRGDSSSMQSIGHEPTQPWAGASESHIHPDSAGHAPLMGESESSNRVKEDWMW